MKRVSVFLVLGCTLVAVPAWAQPAPAPPTCEDQLKLTAKYANGLGGELNALRVRNASLEMRVEELELKLNGAAKAPEAPKPAEKPAKETKK